MRVSEDQKWAANLQPTLNKGGGKASLTIFVTDCGITNLVHELPHELSNDLRLKILGN